MLIVSGADGACGAFGGGDDELALAQPAVAGFFDAGWVALGDGGSSICAAVFAAVTAASGWRWLQRARRKLE